MERNNNSNQQMVNSFFTLVEEDLNDVLSDLERRNSRQLTQMDLIKNMVNECIRELFENFEIDIEDTYLERKLSLSSKVKNFLTENQENFEKIPEITTPKIESKILFSNGNFEEKQQINKEKGNNLNERNHSEKIHSENLIVFEKKQEKNGSDSAKSETKNLDENPIHDMSFSVNQSSDVKNGNTKEIIVSNNDNDQRNKNSKPSFHENTQSSNDQNKRSMHRENNEKNNQNSKEQNPGEKKLHSTNFANEKGKDLKNKHPSYAQNDEKTKKDHHNDKKNENITKTKKFEKITKEIKHEKTEKIVHQEVEKPKQMIEAEKSQKDKKTKEKAFKSYNITPHLSANKTIQELINNSNCKKMSQVLNESNPSNPSSQHIKKSEDPQKNSTLSNSELNEKETEKRNVKKQEFLHNEEDKKIKEANSSHNRNKSEDVLLKKKEEREDFIKKKENVFISEKKDPFMSSRTNIHEKKTEENSNVKINYSSERKERDATPNSKKNPLGQNKFLNYYYFFEEKK